MLSTARAWVRDNRPYVKEWLAAFGFVVGIGVGIVTAIGGYGAFLFLIAKTAGPGWALLAFMGTSLLFFAGWFATEMAKDAKKEALRRAEVEAYDRRQEEALREREQALRDRINRK